MDKEFNFGAWCLSGRILEQLYMELVGYCYHYVLDDFNYKRYTDKGFDKFVDDECGNMFNEDAIYYHNKITDYIDDYKHYNCLPSVMSGIFIIDDKINDTCGWLGNKNVFIYEIDFSGKIINSTSSIGKSIDGCRSLIVDDKYQYNLIKLTTHTSNKITFFKHSCSWVEELRFSIYTSIISLYECYMKTKRLNDAENKFYIKRNNIFDKIKQNTKNMDSESLYKLSDAYNESIEKIFSFYDKKKEIIIDDSLSNLHINTNKLNIPTESRLLYLKLYLKNFIWL